MMSIIRSAGDVGTRRLGMPPLGLQVDGHLHGQALAGQGTMIFAP